MIEVRIRHINDADAVRLMDWDATDLDKVIPLLQSWGLVHSESGEFGADGDLSGQFVVDDDAAYFEVLITGEGA